MARLRIIQGIHYGAYVQSGENLICDKAGRIGINSRFATTNARTHHGS